MTARRAELLSGRAVADAVADRLLARIGELPFTPRLVFVRVGEDPASVYYVRSKQRFAKRVGVDAETMVLPEDVDQATLMRTIAELNADDRTDAVLVQLPLPGHLDAGPVLEAIDPAKDVDGFHPITSDASGPEVRRSRPAPPSGCWRSSTITVSTSTAATW